tara:strand:- start:15 stop:317 length:303 start_codon:yes stop_codon:yes gene_type:complete
MEFSDYIRFLLALIFVIGLIGVVAILARRMGLGFPPTTIKKPANRRLLIEEVLALDAKRKIVLIRCDKEEHLILLSPSNETVIKNNSKQSLEKDVPEDMT